MSLCTGLLKLGKNKTEACLFWGCWSTGLPAGSALGAVLLWLCPPLLLTHPHTQTLAQDQQATVAQKGQATFVLPNKTGLVIRHCPSISQAV